MLYKNEIESPLGLLYAISDEHELHLLDFVDTSQNRFKDEEISSCPSQLIKKLKKELQAYFEGRLKTFSIPLASVGTPFQKSVWRQLLEIPYGKTISYKELAISLSKPTACRAVAGANGANRFPIIIPCHRVINSNGDLGGYNCGLNRKKWLLNHEKSRD